MTVGEFRLLERIYALEKRLNEQANVIRTLRGRYIRCLEDELSSGPVRDNILNWRK